MANTREEQLRNSRRLARQIVGAVALVLMLIGLISVLSWCVGALRQALDDSDRREAYAERVYGLVMFDVPAFEDVSQVDETVFRQAAIWGTVYQIQQSEGTLDGYERDATTGSLILPRLEIDTYLTNLLGPDYPLTEGSFETDAFIYTYDEEKQGYLLPVTGSVGLYTPEVEKFTNSGGKLYVTVGYIPTLNNSETGDFSLTAPTEPTKYMDFVFERGSNRQWYLSALQESEMQVEASSSSSSAPAASSEITDPQTVLESNLNPTAAPDAAASDAEAPTDQNDAAPADDSAVNSTDSAPADDGGGTADSGDTGDGTDSGGDASDSGGEG